jgi:transcriptional regulator with XRE-family HTH domain
MKHDALIKMLGPRIGQRARTARAALGQTQADVAEAVGLATEVYGRLERGGMLPSVPTLVLLAAALKVTPNDLLGDVAELRAVPETVKPSQQSALRPLMRKLEQASPAELRRVQVVLGAILGKARR